MNSSLSSPWHPSDPPKFHRPTPPNLADAAGWQALIILFYHQKLSETKYSEFNRFSGTTACMRLFLPHKSRDPHVYLSRASWTCGYTMAHQRW
jgi:hypothetical protein